MNANAQTYLNQARSFLLDGNPAKAVDLLKKARALCRDEPQLSALILKDLVAACRSCGRWEDAGRYSVELNALSPGGGGRQADPVNDPVSLPRSPRVVAVALASVVIVISAIAGIYFLTKPKVTAIGSTPPPPPPEQANLEAAKARRKANIPLMVVLGDYSVDGFDVDVVCFTGTAFAFDTQGYLMTSRHLIDDQAHNVPKKLTLWTDDDGKHIGVLKTTTLLACFGKERSEHLDARLVHHDSQIDMAILKVDRKFPNPYELNDGEPAESSAATAVGYPGETQDLLNDLTADDYIIKDHIRHSKPGDHFSLLDEYFQKDSYESTPYPETVLRTVTHRDVLTDVMERSVEFNGSIQPGNSGGPLLGRNDKVLGIVTWKQGKGNDTNYAISSYELRQQVERWRMSQ